MIKQGQYPFFVASSLAFFSATIVWLLPRIDQDTIEKEDREFMAYLIKNGWDVSQMGTEEWQEKRRASVQDAVQEAQAAQTNEHAKGLMARIHGFKRKI